MIACIENLIVGLFSLRERTAKLLMQVRVRHLPAGKDNYFFLERLFDKKN